MTIETTKGRVLILRTCKEDGTSRGRFQRNADELIDNIILAVGAAMFALALAGTAGMVSMSNIEQMEKDQ